jgi:hypothetical protein
MFDPERLGYWLVLEIDKVVVPVNAVGLISSRRLACWNFRVLDCPEDQEMAPRIEWPARVEEGHKRRIYPYFILCQPDVRPLCSAENLSRFWPQRVRRRL